jgi:hypothetical protein
MVGVALDVGIDSKVREVFLDSQHVINACSTGETHRCAAVAEPDCGVGR